MNNIPARKLPVFGSSSPRFPQEQKKSTPGPGSYNPKPVSNQVKGGSFLKAERFHMKKQINEERIATSHFKEKLILSIKSKIQEQIEQVPLFKTAPYRSRIDALNRQLDKLKRSTQPQAKDDFVKEINIKLKNCFKENYFIFSKPQKRDDSCVKGENKVFPKYLEYSPESGAPLTVYLSKLSTIRTLLTGLHAKSNDLDQKLKLAKDIFEKNDLFKTIKKETENLLQKGDISLLPTYYFAKLLKDKVLKKDDKEWVYPRMFTNGNQGATAQCLVINSNGEIVLEKRGRFKRLFADKLTTSLNISFKTSELPQKKILEALSKAGLFQLERKEAVEKIDVKNTFFYSIDYVAITQLEKHNIKMTYDTYKDKCPAYTHLEFDKVRNVLTIVHSSNNDNLFPEVEAFQLTISDQSKINPIFPVKEKQTQTLFVYKMNAEESAKVQNGCRDKNRQVSTKRQDLNNPEILKLLDSDSYEITPWEQVKQRSQNFSGHFATDVIGVHFTNPTTLTKLDQSFLHLQPITIQFSTGEAPISLVGGKGSNLGKLTALQRESEHNESTPFVVPTGFTLSTVAYAKETANVFAKVEELQRLSKEYITKSDNNEKKIKEKEIKEKANEIRTAINSIQLSNATQQSIFQEYNLLQQNIQERKGDGTEYPVAVRSSGTAEDIDGISAAGMAKSILTVDKNNLISSIKKVWKSMFDDEFVLHRARSGQTQFAQMAVVVQEMVQANKSGVMMSISNGRPVFRIAGNFGFGEATVGGECNVDNVTVSIGGRILEKYIPEKTVIYKSDASQPEGVRKVELDKALKMPVLTDEEAKKLAKLGKQFSKIYSDNGIKDIDVEWVFDSEEQLYIVQCRAENSGKSLDGEDQVLTVVDESNVPLETTSIQLDGLNACSGVVIGTLRCVASDDIGGVQRGDIIFTEFTNNQWNEALSGGVAGVITMQGDYSSHAAKNSREYNLPCLVGVGGSQKDTIKKYSGRQVTLDTVNQRIYFDTIPTKKITIKAKVWRSPEELDHLANKHSDEERGGWDRLFEIGHTMTSGISRKKFIGRPKIEFSQLQLDAYVQGWEKMYAILDEFLERKKKFKLTTLERTDAPVVNVVKEGVLYRSFEGNESKQIISVAMNQFSLEDFEAFLVMKQVAVMTLEKFFDTLSIINDKNIAEVMDNYSSYLAWMHTAHYLDVNFKRMFFDDYCDPISAEFLNTFENASMNQESLHINASEETVTVDSEELKRFQKRDLLRTKTKLTDEIIATILTDPLLKTQFDKGDDSFVEFISNYEQYSVFGLKISALANHFKADSEDIRKEDSTLDCLAKIRASLDTSDDKYQERLGDYLLKSLPNASNLSFDNFIEQIRNTKLESMVAVYNDRLQTKLTEEEVFQILLTQIKEKEAKAIQAQGELQHYPQLCRVLQFSFQEGRLREDCHQEVVKIQYKLKNLLKNTGLLDFEKTISETVMMFKGLKEEKMFEQLKDLRKKELEAERKYEGREHIQRKGKDLVYVMDNKDNKEITLLQLETLSDLGLIENINNSGRNNYFIWNCNNNDFNFSSLKKHGFSEELIAALKVSYKELANSYKSNPDQASKTYIDNLNDILKKYQEIQKSISLKKHDPASANLIAEIKKRVDKLNTCITNKCPEH